MKALSQKSQPNLIRPLRNRAKKASFLLHKEYGSPRHGNKENPLDELVFIILSLMTTHHSFTRMYNRLKSYVKRWDRLLTIKLTVFRSIIKDGGLSDQKARRILQIIHQLKNDFGKVTLSPLEQMTDSNAEGYLSSLPGVGVKTAKCVMMYSFGRRVLPVDTHVWRVATRLGLIGKLISYSSVHKKLEEVVLPEDRYSFHVNSISHGRRVCLPLRPRCYECCLNRLCPFPTESKPARQNR